jgi:drug/metabolite transporter (DMT)-like permease
MRRVALAAILAMVAFAANSVLCRMALRGTAIDPATFMSVRLVTGAVTLWVIVRLTRGRLGGAGDWGSAAALLVYAVPFSFAYVGLTAGTGALLLFGAVQLMMVAAGLLSGERFTALAASGWVLAIAGVIVLVAPGVSAPPPRDAGLMVIAGVAWGVYSLRGRSSTDAIRDTAGNFLRAAPGSLLLSALLWAHHSWDPVGALLATLSGALASGLGYVAWYTALPRLSAITAANLQLSVPVIAAFAGVLLFAEPITWRLALAAVMVLGGIAIASNRARLRARA